MQYLQAIATAAQHCPLLPCHIPFTPPHNEPLRMSFVRVVTVSYTSVVNTHPRMNSHMRHHRTPSQKSSFKCLAVGHPVKSGRSCACSHSAERSPACTPGGMATPLTDRHIQGSHHSAEALLWAPRQCHWQLHGDSQRAGVTFGRLHCGAGGPRNHSLRESPLRTTCSSKIPEETDISNSNTVPGKPAPVTEPRCGSAHTTKILLQGKWVRLKMITCHSICPGFRLSSITFSGDAIPFCILSLAAKSSCAPCGHSSPSLGQIQAHPDAATPYSASLRG